jgi:hypothetical protein
MILVFLEQQLPSLLSLRIIDQQNSKKIGPIGYLEWKLEIIKIIMGTIGVMKA